MHKNLVKIPTTIFYHKSNPDLKFPSVGCGVVEKIQIGPRRSIEKIIIKFGRIFRSIG